MPYMFKSFPFYRQPDSMDCGPTCLRMIAAHHGKEFSLPFLRERMPVDREGVSVNAIRVAAETLGMEGMAVEVPLETQEETYGLDVCPLPCILYWEQNHFVVLYELGRKWAKIADPAMGKRKVSREELERAWLSGRDEGVVLLLEPKTPFFEQETARPPSSNWRILWGYLKAYKEMGWYLAASLAIITLLQVIFPLGTQAIVDRGISNRDIDFIYLVLGGLLFLMIGQLTVRVIQSSVLLHLGTRVNIRLVVDFLNKIIRLPLSFFDKKMTGDLLQRLDDQKRIELLLTNATLGMLFSFFSLVVLGGVLAYYNWVVFVIFLLGSLAYLGWIIAWMRRRAVVDQLRFRQEAEHQERMIEIIQGIQEIKLQGSGARRQNKWMGVRKALFQVNMDALVISQSQDVGAGFINQVKDILITLITAKAVVGGQMTLGMMLAVQYIAGQLNVPMKQIGLFFRVYQDANLSLDRLNEIHAEREERMVDEETPVPEGDIILNGVSFAYNQYSDEVLKNISVSFPKGKITAIVGESGGGKTTLAKLLLGFYEPTKGFVTVGGVKMTTISPTAWRRKCGAVLQGGFIFSDSIAENIAESEVQEIELGKVIAAAKMANIHDFIEGLPLGYFTKIGDKGNALSQGQQQRILIARAIYKDPNMLILDEATNALDAENESIILKQLSSFLKGKTVVVIAHRLSTIQEADQILVLSGGRVVEQGTHLSLLEKGGTYFRLVERQL